jgi:hypothetical protein
MEKNKTGKYFKYAIGEIVLVVIGILIALQINNYNEGRKELQREIKMLFDLKNDIKNNIVNINEGIIRMEQGVDNNLKKEGVNLISNNNLRNKIIELYEIDMDILDVSDLNRHNDYMNSVGNRILNKHFYFDSENGYQPFDYEKMMSDNEYFSFVTFFMRHQQVALSKSQMVTKKAKLINEKITQEIKQLQ